MQTIRFDSAPDSLLETGLPEFADRPMRRLPVAGPFFAVLCVASLCLGLAGLLRCR